MIQKDSGWIMEDSGFTSEGLGIFDPLNERKDLGRSPNLPSPTSAHEAAVVHLAAVFFFLLLPAAFSGGDGTLLPKTAIAALLELIV